jgi:hypothetical protein
LHPRHSGLCWAMPELQRRYVIGQRCRPAGVRVETDIASAGPGNLSRADPRVVASPDRSFGQRLQPDLDPQLVVDAHRRQIADVDGGDGQRASAPEADVERAEPLTPALDEGCFKELQVPRVSEHRACGALLRTDPLRVDKGGRVVLIGHPLVSHVARRRTRSLDGQTGAVGRPRLARSSQGRSRMMSMPPQDAAPARARQTRPIPRINGGYTIRRRNGMIDAM